jgi:chromosome segregation ATPase
MTTEFENEISAQLKELRATAEKVAELNNSISRAADELTKSGSVASLNLNYLREKSLDTTQALNSLLSASDFFVTLRNISEPTVTAISGAIDRAEKSLMDIEGRAKSLLIEATDQVLKSSEVAFEPILKTLSRAVEDAVKAISELEARNSVIVSATVNNMASAAEAVNSKLETVPIVLNSLNNAGQNLTSQVSDLASSISGLRAELEAIHNEIAPDDESSKIDLLTEQLHLAIPPSVLTFFASAFLLDLGLTESLTLAAFSFLPIMFGKSSKKVIDLFVPGLKRLIAKLKNANII